MARMVSWPAGLAALSIDVTSGPRTSGIVTEGTTASVQTSQSPFGYWGFRFGFPATREAGSRAFRGWVASMNGGANATRVPFFDPDIMSYLQSGVTVTSYEETHGIPWDNGQSWSNLANWSVGRPLVAVSATSSIQTAVVNLANTDWGHLLQVGDYIGFTPFHFGMYIVTEIIQDGRYRVWPPLRKALATTDYATLSPVLAMRMVEEGAADVSRGLFFSESPSISLVEVFDYDVATYFAD